MHIGFIKQILKRPADIPELTLKKSKTSLPWIHIFKWVKQNFEIPKFSKFDSPYKSYFPIDIFVFFSPKI